MPGRISPVRHRSATVSSRTLFAVGWENKVVLVRPEDGAVLAKIPYCHSYRGGAERRLRRANV